MQQLTGVQLVQRLPLFTRLPLINFPEACVSGGPTEFCKRRNTKERYAWGTSGRRWEGPACKFPGYNTEGGEQVYIIYMFHTKIITLPPCSVFHGLNKKLKKILVVDKNIQLTGTYFGSFFFSFQPAIHDCTYYIINLWG